MDDPKSAGKVCYAFQEGKCERGQECRFLHEKAKGEEAKAVTEALAQANKAGGMFRTPFASS